MYCTVEEVRSVATQMTEASIGDEPVAALIVRASRMFDLLTGVEPGYFEARGDGVATARTIYGDGTNYLKLPPYVPGTLSTTISTPDGYTTPEFITQNGYLVRAETGVVVRHPSTVVGWHAGVPITVTAKWGYESTPEDVKAAVIELVINLWRETDPAFVKIVNIDNQPLRERLPPRVQMIVKQYHAKQGVFL